MTPLPETRTRCNRAPTFGRHSNVVPTRNSENPRTIWQYRPYLVKKWRSYRGRDAVTSLPEIQLLEEPVEGLFPFGGVVGVVGDVPDVCNMVRLHVRM